MNPTQRWVYALKPASWPKVFVPAVLGQAVGAASAGRLSAGALAFGLLWMLADVAFIVLLNDWGDREVDALKRRMFPKGCSPKTIPDGILPARALLVAGLGAGVLALLVAGVAGVLLARPALLPLAALGLFVFAAYTLPPLRLNYRGGGEVLEMVGVGGVLPALHAYAQCGQWAPLELKLLAPGLLALCLSSALASGLSDEESDRAGGKRTFTTLLGNPVSRRASEALLVLGALLWLGAAWLSGNALPRGGLVLAALLTLFFAARVWRKSPSAVTNAFGAQAAYKLELHRAIWWATLALSAWVLATGLGERR
ncbi:prenyltransferase [Stigmatella sp. ncwal1]|uniref:Prenyltransferase n=1 Tax=Stigmatella ashevillensis TaxID=2995309 RepID=A0ABT5DNL3_9BACT|nr:prenyltransferase [Stigmatella ashevillena]MDC0715131.1 prenyltransferase [Stigmatella ashevillena]